MGKILKFGCLGIIGLVVIVVIISALASGNKDNATVVSNSGSSSVGTATPMPKIGDTVSIENWQYQVAKVDRQKSVAWSSFGNTADAKGIWEVVLVKLENTGKQTYPINTWDFEIRDSNGIKYTAASDSVMFSDYNKLSKPMDNYPPGVPAEIGLLFDVNPAATGLKLHLNQGNVDIALDTP